MLALRITDPNLGTTANKRGNNRKRRRIAHVIRVRFERHPENRDGLAVDRAAAKVEQLVDHPSLDLVIDLDNCFGDLHRNRMFLPDPGKRPCVLGET